MKSTRFFLMAAAVLLFITAGCANTNQYMVANSPQYKEITQNFVGTWVVQTYRKGDSTDNLLDNPFEKATLQFSFNSKRVEYTFWVSDSYLDRKLSDWRQQYPDLKVDDYKIIITSEWHVGKDGDVLNTSPKKGEEEHNIVIKGSGANFDGFYQWERSKFEAGKNVGKGSGLMGLMVNKVAKQATGTSELFTEMADNYTFKFSDQDKRLFLCRKGAIYKTETATCTERLELQKVK